MSLTVSLFLFSCASSRTNVIQANKTTQAVLTGGVSLLNDSSTPPVKLQLSGEILLSKKCQFLNNHFTVEILRPLSNKYLFVAEVNAQNTYLFDVGLASEGEYTVQLVNARGNKIIEVKKLTATKANDRQNLNFHGCPE